MSEALASDLHITLKASGFTAAGKVADICFRYLMLAFLAWVLGAEALGIFILGRTLVMVVSLGANLGMGYGVVRQVAYYSAQGDAHRVQQSIRVALVIPFAVTLILAVLLWRWSDWISLDLFHKAALAMPLKMLAISIPIQTVVQILMEVLRGFKAIRQRVLAEYYVLPLSNLILLLGLCYLGGGLAGAVWAFTLSYGITLAVLVFMNRGRIRLRGAGPFIDRNVALSFFRFSFPLTFVNILSEVKVRLDVLFLGWLCSAADTGIFFIALRLAGFLSIPWQAAHMAFAPLVSGYYAEGDVRKIEYQYKNITKLMFLGTMYLWGFVTVFSRELLAVFGEEFGLGVGVVWLICLGQLVKTLVGNAGPMLVMIGRSSVNLVIMIVTLALLAVLNLALIPVLGMTGAALANLATVTITSLLELYCIHRLLRIHPFRPDFLKPVLAGLLSAGIVHGLKMAAPPQPVFLVLLLVCFTLLYSVILYWQRLSPEEEAILSSLLRKAARWVK